LLLVPPPCACVASTAATPDSAQPHLR
jgi:hypothetical protein